MSAMSRSIPIPGRSRILRYTAFQDVGKALNPIAVEGQIEGSVVQGIGWALTEGYDYGADGRLRNASLLDYRLPTALDVPDIDCVIIETPVPDVPYGLRGVGGGADRAGGGLCRQCHSPRRRRAHRADADDAGAAPDGDAGEAAGLSPSVEERGTCRPICASPSSTIRASSPSPIAAGRWSGPRIPMMPSITRWRSAYRYIETDVQLTRDGCGRRLS